MFPLAVVFVLPKSGPLHRLRAARQASQRHSPHSLSVISVRLQSSIATVNESVASQASPWPGILQRWMTTLRSQSCWKQVGQWYVVT